MSRFGWLLASLALVIAPHLGHLPLWVGPLCLGLGLWRTAVERGRARLPGRPLLVALTLACTIALLAEFRTLLGRDAGVALLTAMTALKLMEMKSPRDTMTVIFLAYFLVIAAFLYSQEIPMVLYLLLAVGTITTTMIGYSDINQGLTTRARLRLGVTLLLQAAPLMLVLFVFFPRVPPLWALPEDAHAGLSGLSDSMSPGAISRLIQSEAVAFRVQFDTVVPPAARRYWRGPVLWDYDGRTWSTRNAPPADSTQIELRGPPLHYTLTLEPHNQRWLFALELPAAAPPDSHATADMQLLARTPVHQRLRYRLASHPDYRLGPTLSLQARQRALALPDNTNPRTRALAAHWRDAGHPPEARIEQALGMIRNQRFFYTLTPPRLGTEAVDDFLFDTRRGFCEHYAGAFVFLMRASGIPARVVTGYQGGSHNAIGDYLIVRQSDAHAWAEVWLAGRGWVRIDPTAAVAPNRIEQGIAAALPTAELPLAMAQRNIAWLQRLRLSWDLANNHWNQWVLGYGQARQLDLLARLHTSLATWAGMAVALAAGLTGGLAVIAIWVLWRGPRHRIDPALACYNRFCARLARRGLVRLPHEGPTDFSRRAGLERPDLAARIADITHLYIRLRYGRSRPDGRALRQAVRRFRP
jgi:transglutaminase-like putative cysteine protease